VPKENLSEGDAELTCDGESFDMPAKLFLERTPPPRLQQVAAFRDKGCVPRSLFRGYSVQALAGVATQRHGEG
jgi:hypothetical protein